MTRSTTPASGRHQVRLEFYPLRARVLEVQRVARVTPGTARVTLAGPDLAGFRTDSPDDHVRLYFPLRPGEEPLLPEVGSDGVLDPPTDRPQPVYRDYTVRAYRPEAGELDVDLVLHEGGHGSAWAAQAAPGQRIGVVGPRGTRHVSRTFDWYLLVGDETALPAIGRWVEELPAGTRMQVVAEVAGPQEEQQWESAADVDVLWCHRAGAPAGCAPNLLADALRGIELPAGEGYCWAAGEATALKPVRRYLRRERGLPAAHVDVDGYWRRGVVNLDHHGDPEPGD